MSRMWSAVQKVGGVEMAAATMHAIGIDFGGTNTKMGLLDFSGHVLAESSFPTAGCCRPKDFALRVAQEAARLMQRTRVAPSGIAGVGIGVPGLVDNVRGIVHTLVNVSGWDGVNVAALLGEPMKLPIHVENDVNAMALGELRYGVAKGFENVVCVTLGTGVGGGLILGGRLYHGATLTAGEIGHIVVDSRGPQCNCGSKGCLEALIGTAGVVRRARAYMKEAAKKRKKGVLRGWLHEGKELTPQLLAKAACQGDKTALRTWDETARYLGIVFAGITNLLNPDLFVVGGGISAAGDFFLDRVREVLIAYAMAVPAKKVRVLRSALGNHAGVLGAGSLAFERKGGKRG